MIFVSNEGIEGIYIAEVFSNKDLGLYCAVTARNKPGITEWMDWYFFHQMFLLGVETIYFGGSESKGVDYYIKKLLPDTPTYQIQTYEFICKK